MYRSHRSRDGRRVFKTVLLPAILVAAAGLLALALLRHGAAPVIEIEPALPGIGPRTPVTVRVAEPQRGLSDVTVELVQGERIHPLAERRHLPRPFWAFWGPRTERDELALEVGKETLPELQPGPAVLRVTAGRAGTWLRRPAAATHELPMEVRLAPPVLQALSSDDRVSQGGSAAVVYRVGETAVRDGVRAGDAFFPGYPLPGGAAGERFALYAAPHDLEDGRQAILLEAEDELGNRVSLPFLRGYTAKRRPEDDIRLSDDFIARKVPEILARTPQLADQGDPLATYLAINRDLRQSNARTLVELARRSRAERLWRDGFVQLPNSRVMATYGDRRTYFYDGQEVDVQHHLGYDLASVRRAEVPAASRGQVLFADYLGIYGNTVVLDHGYGLMSLYSHLSEIAVSDGQVVQQGTVVGRTGVTGLAGGDHLHFSMLVHGQQVDPIEWWDRSWIRNRITDRLGDGFRTAD